MRSVLRLTGRNIASNRLRFGLTAFAVLLGVSFVVASFVMTDGLLKTFDAIAQESNEEIDVRVVARSDFDETLFADRSIDESVVDLVASVDGVGAVEPGLESVRIIPVAADGDPVTTAGAPIISVNWGTEIGGALTIVDGEAPAEPGEFAMDEDSADRDGFAIGNTYEVIGVDGPETFELTGITRFGDQNALAGAVLMSFTLDDIQRLEDAEGQLTLIEVAAGDGVDPDVLLERIDAALPTDLEVMSQAEVVADDQDEFQDVVSIFGNILLGFGLVAVFVSVFIIGNTFNILLGQRVRQLALLRALGASGAQVRTSALLEALLVGVVASILGLGGGVLLAIGLTEVMNSLGFTLPSIELIISARTVIVALVVGIGVTLAASLSPARRAATVPPVAAMRDGFRFGSGEGTRRTIIAIVLVTLGSAALAYGLFVGVDNGIFLLSLLSGGAVLVFVSVSMFAPLFSSPSASFLGWPAERFPGARVTGRIARQNAASNNKRTASTASGLMIGLALIAMASVTAESLKSSFRAELGSTLIADMIVTGPNDGAFTPVLAGQIDELPEFDQVSAVRYGNIRVDGDTKAVTAVDLTLLTELIAVDVSDGDPAAVANPQSIVISDDVAGNLDVAVGDTLDVEFAATGVQPLTVGATYENEFLVGGYLVDLTAWDANFDTRADNVVAMRASEGTSLDAAGASLSTVEAQFAQLEFETQDEFSDRLEGQLDSLLIVINVFLGLAIIIALLGIANTMALSVLERTREIGLMRAIGMTRRQTRRMIRLEAGVVSLFGALLGVVVGLLFGWVAVLAIPDTIIDRLSIPGVTLVLYVAVATIAGLLAASFPARRAARLNVLDAITYE